MAEPALISFQGITKTFLTEHLETTALNEVFLNIDKGEYIAVMGPSGCGKSTLLSVMGLLTSSSAGTYLLNDKNVAELSADDRAQLRNKEIGFVFQSFNLIGEMTVQQNVRLPLTYQRGLSSSDMKDRVGAALDQVEMGHRADHFPSQLSGGQQQRVAIARALVGSPSILLADEPTGNLDSRSAEGVMMLLDQLHQQGNTICIVTHDNDAALRSSRQISLFDGKVVEDRREVTPADGART